MTIVPPSPPDGWHVERRDVVPSTQSILSELLAREVRDRQVVTASRQTAGRGRAANSWESPRGGLWCSFSLLRDEPPDPFLGLFVARAAQRAVQDLVGESGTRLALKWPNDLVVGERKWGGVLTEVETIRDRQTLARVGVGLNLDIPLARLPQVPGVTITSIHAEFGSSPSADAVLVRMLAHVDTLLAHDLERGRQSSRELLESCMATIRRRIRWQEPTGERAEGMALGLDASGGLRVRLGEGREKVLRAAQIRHVRALP